MQECPRSPQGAANKELNSNTHTYCVCACFCLYVGVCMGAYIHTGASLGVCFVFVEWADW